MHQRLASLALVLCLPLLAQPEYTIDTFAGGDPLNDGSPATEGYLAYPDDVAVMPDGGFLIADRENRVIRRVSADGTIETIAGFRTRFGSSEVAREIFVEPSCVASSPDGRMFYCDSFRVREVLPDGRVRLFAGANSGYNGDGGPASEARLRVAGDMTFASDGTAYIADFRSHTVRKVSPDGMISTFAGIDQSPGFSGDGGPANQAQLSGPAGLAVAPDGAILILDESNRRIRRVGPDGMISTIAGTGNAGRPTEGQSALEASFSFNRSITALPSGDVLIADTSKVYSVGVDGLIRTFAGTGSASSSGDGGPATAASFFGVNGMDAGADGSVYLTDSSFHRIRRIEASGVIDTVAGRDRRGLGAPRPARETVFLLPEDVTTAPDGSVYVSESASSLVRRIDPAGQTSVFAGTGVAASDGDGGAAVETRISRPRAVAWDATRSSLLISEGRRVRRVDSEGIITTLAGTGDRGSSGDGGPATEAEFLSVSELAVGPDGSVYVVDLDDHRVRVIRPDGTIHAFAGRGGRGSDGDGGPAIEARLNFPQEVIVGDDGSVFINDVVNGAIRRVRPDGIIETALSLTFSPVAMELESPGVFLLSTTTRIERQSLDGLRETIVGSMGTGYFGDGGPAAEGGVRRPLALARTVDGRILIADSDNHRIRVLAPPADGPQPELSSQGIVQAASFVGGRMAAETIVSVFGRNLAARTEQATSTPLPFALGGSTAVIIDSTGTERAAQFFFASSGQLNLFLPAGLASGDGTLRIRSEGGRVGEAALGINSSAPGLFSADATGQGTAAAAWQLVRADDSRDGGLVFEFDQAQQSNVATAIPLGNEGDQVFLVLFGTGIRGDGDQVTVLVDGVEVAVLYAGPQGEFVGLDQVNIGPIPRSVAGKTVTIELRAAGRVANSVTVTFAP